MKLFKKLLIISAFSFLFIINANALTNFTTHNLQSLDNYLSNNPDKNENDYVNMIFENIDLPSEEYLGENYIVLIDTTYAFVQMRIISSNDLFHVAYDNNYGNPVLYLRSDIYEGSYNFCRKTIQFTSQGNYSTSNAWSCSTSNGSWIDLFARNYNSYIIASNYDTLSYKAPTWGQDSFSIDNGTQYQFNSDNIPINFTNGNLYNFDVIDIFSNYIPIISQPYTEQFSNYTNTIFKINNYSYNSVDIEGLRIDIINNNNGNREFVQPNLNGEEIIITKTDYENTSYTIQLYDNDYNIIEEYSINANVIYYNENFNVNIFNINNQNKTINYSYDINYEDDVYCYHVINSSNEILDPNCKSSDNNFQLTLNNNGNVQFIIKNSNNEILFKYNQNFVFDVSQPYINFIDKFENNFLTLDVIINRFNSSDVVRYSINNGEYFIVSYFENINLDVGDVRKFTISNLNNNDVIKVQILRNNNIIAESSFNVFFNKYPQEENFNLKNFFNKIDINNISNELREYIINIGNIIINSKIGNLILLEFFILIITWVLKLIVN